MLGLNCFNEVLQWWLEGCRHRRQEGKVYCSKCRFYGVERHPPTETWEVAIRFRCHAPQNGASYSVVEDNWLHKTTVVKQKDKVSPIRQNWRNKCTWYKPKEKKNVDTN